MKSKNIFSVSLFCGLGLLVACEKTIFVKPLVYSNQISIQGLITPNERPRLYLSLTVPYFSAKSTNAQLFIRNAKVKLTSVGESEILMADSTYSPFRCTYEYFYIGKNIIKANQSYQLDIETNGQNFTATATTNLPIVSVENITYVKAFKDVYGEHEGIVIDFNDKALNAYYRYTMAKYIDSSARNAEGLKSPCLGVKPEKILEIGRTLYPTKNINNSFLTIVAEPTYKHKNGEIGYIRLQTTDKNIFDFFDQLDRQKLAQYNPFVEPVFLKPTQFKNAVGVFGAYSVSDSVKFVYPE